MSGASGRWKWMLWVALFVVGCRGGLPEQELKDIRSLQRGWLQILASHEAKTASLVPVRTPAPAKVALPDSVVPVAAVVDTAPLMPKPINVQAHRMQDSYSRAMRIHLYNLKQMRNFLQETEAWTLRAEEQALTADLVRRGWAGKVALFDQHYRKMKQSEETLLSLYPAVEASKVPSGDS
jgi:hypothetical protein